MNIIQRVTAFFLGLLLTLVVAAPAMAVEVVTYYHLDAAGTPVAATNSSGSVIWREHYYPYGERLKTDAGAASSANPLWYTGQAEDNDAGLMYYGARWYNPQLGRFMSMDPAGLDLNNAQSFNKYAYANNNPYKFVDPDGRIPIPAIIAIGRIVYPLLVAGVDAWALSADAPGARGGFSRTPVADGVQRGIATGQAEAGVAKKTVTDPVDLTDFRRDHILNRHAPGAGKSGKTEFPADWDESKILHEISDVATDPRSTVIPGRWGADRIQGTRDGVDITVDMYPSSSRHSGKISTGYPTNTPANQ